MTEEEIITESHHGRQPLEQVPMGGADAGGGEAVPIIERYSTWTEHLTFMVAGERRAAQLDQSVGGFSRPQGAGQAIPQIDDLIDVEVPDVGHHRLQRRQIAVNV